MKSFPFQGDNCACKLHTAYETDAHRWLKLLAVYRLTFENVVSKPSATNLFPKQQKSSRSKFCLVKGKNLSGGYKTLASFEFYILNEGADGRHACLHGQHKG